MPHNVLLVLCARGGARRLGRYCGAFCRRCIGVLRICVGIVCTCVLHLALRVCADPVVYPSLWLKCAANFQQIANTSSVNTVRLDYVAKTDLRDYKLRLRIIFKIARCIRSRTKVAILSKSTTVFNYHRGIRIFIRVSRFRLTIDKLVYPGVELFEADSYCLNNLLIILNVGC